MTDQKRNFLESDLSSGQAAGIGSGWTIMSRAMILRRMRFSRHGSIHSYTNLSQGFHTVDQMNMVTIPVKMIFAASDEEAKMVFVIITRKTSSVAAMRMAMVSPIRLRLREIRIKASLSACFASAYLRTALTICDCRPGLI